jgi:hypothetical protein
MAKSASGDEVRGDPQRYRDPSWFVEAAEIMRTAYEAHKDITTLTNGMKHRPRTTFGTMNADVLQHFDSSFVRDDFVEIIRNCSWPE